MPPRLLILPEALQRRATKQPPIRCIELLGGAGSAMASGNAARNTRLSQKHDGRTASFATLWCHHFRGLR
jgi:hypothetical protein